MSACGAKNQAAESGKLLETVNAFNLMVRWQQWQNAAAFIEPKQAPKWMAQRIKSSQSVRIAEVTLAGVTRVPDDAPDAKVFVQITWYGANALTVRTSLWEQSWKLLDDGWRLMKEKPAEAAPAPTGDEADNGPSWP
jgi:hypothetical protein